MRFLQDNSTATLHTVGLSRGDAAITCEPRLPIHCKSMLLPNVQYRGAHDFSKTTIRCMRLVMMQKKRHASKSIIEAMPADLSR
jgi:hypothetical protein